MNNKYVILMRLYSPIVKGETREEIYSADTLKDAFKTAYSECRFAYGLGTKVECEIYNSNNEMTVKMCTDFVKSDTLIFQQIRILNATKSIHSAAIRFRFIDR